MNNHDGREEEREASECEMNSVALTGMVFVSVVLLIVMVIIF